MISKYSTLKLLNESKKSAIAKFVDTNKINTHTFDQLLLGDPTSSKKYIEKMCQLYVEVTTLHIRYRGVPVMENIMMISDMIADYHDGINKNKIQGSDRDIGSIRNWEQFEAVVIAARSIVTKSSKKKKSGSNKNGIVVYEDDRWHVAIPFNWTGAKHFGRGVKWCITFNAPNYWMTYFWKKGSHFYVITDKPANQVQVSDQDKDPLNRVCAEVDKDGVLVDMWDAPDNNFNPMKNTSMDAPRSLWWNDLPDKIKDIIKTADDQGQARIDAMKSDLIATGHDKELNVETVIIKDLVVTKELQLDFSVFKGIKVIAEGAVRIEGSELESLKSLNLGALPKIENLEIIGNPNLTSLEGIPKNISWNLIIKDNPKLESIDDLVGIKVHKHIHWINNGSKLGMMDFLRKKIIPRNGKIVTR